MGPKSWEAKRSETSTLTSATRMSDNKKRVAVVGGGLVGSLNACFLAKRGFHVDLYEKRPDIRTQEIVRGRSINLALSHRGRQALKHVGLEDEVVQNGIPMYARMIHNKDGSTRPIPYGRRDQYIMSVDRRRLNELLLSAADERENVTLHFEHKLVNCDLKTGEIIFEKPDKTKVKQKVDLILGNDGAFSAVRKEMIRQSSRFNYAQEYIPHGYMELVIKPTSSGEFAMATNYLHIWPRNEFMMIGLPNQDKTFTATLFMPFAMFEEITSEKELMEFFTAKFPDSIPLIGEDALKKTFFSGKGLPMVSIKCSPYHFGDKALLMGDAAHAMVPFYGQGMNAGFEDLLVFDEILDQCDNDLSASIEQFTNFRNIDAQAICDLAMYNYIEMRKSVNSPLFLLRKRIDNLLYTLFPKSWIPLYTMVSFTRTRYHECINKRKWQDQVIKKLCVGMAVVGVASACFTVYRLLDGDEELTLGERITNMFQRASLWTVMKGIRCYLYVTD
ncbi:kynurenine 3-monooxygenase-like isoform X1 [Haliotis asinina]|uniref:kynurenine 3-monooxygenase-like isoform X1 n=1 Tax=Haliotis asinina TaxID=109174 RepID=UPI0035327F5A